MQRNEKIVASTLLSLGLVSSIVSIIRLLYIQGLDVQVREFPDPAIGISSVFESGIAEVACCIATYRPLLRKMKAVWGSSTAANATASSEGPVVPGGNDVDAMDRRLNIDVKVSRFTIGMDQGPKSASSSQASKSWNMSILSKEPGEV